MVSLLTVNNDFLPNLSLLNLFCPRQVYEASILLNLFHNTQLQMHLLLRDPMKDTPLVKESRKKKEKAQHPAGFEPTTLRVLLCRCVHYGCATTAAPTVNNNVMPFIVDINA